MEIKKKFAILACVVALLGCEPTQRPINEKEIFDATQTVTLYCISGVLYYKHGHGLAPAVRRHLGTEMHYIKCGTPENERTD